MKVDSQNEVDSKNVGGQQKRRWTAKMKVDSKNEGGQQKRRWTARTKVDIKNEGGYGPSKITEGCCEPGDFNEGSRNSRT